MQFLTASYNLRYAICQSHKTPAWRYRGSWLYI